MTQYWNQLFLALIENQANLQVTPVGNRGFGFPQITPGYQVLFQQGELTEHFHVLLIDHGITVAEHTVTDEDREVLAWCKAVQGTMNEVRQASVISCTEAVRAVGQAETQLTYHPPFVEGGPVDAEDEIQPR